MELMAFIVGLRVLKQQCSVVMYSDSQYVVNGLQKGWVENWRNNNWMRQEGEELKEVKNVDLWQELVELYEYHDVGVHWVKGHAGVTENKRCHQLCKEAMRKPNLPIDTVFERQYMKQY